MSLASVSTVSAQSTFRQQSNDHWRPRVMLSSQPHPPPPPTIMHSLPECISAVPIELPGTIARRFTLHPSSTQCVLGSGSYAIVRQLKDKETGEYYALKAVQKQPLIDRGMLDRIYNEIATHQELRHENILTLHGYFEDSTHIYMQLELATGGVLSNWQSRCFPPYGRVAERQAAIIFRQILSAVDHLHRRNIAHRDLKTANVLMMRSYGPTDTDISVRLCDFGWSTSCDDEAGAENEKNADDDSPPRSGSVGRRRTLCGTVDSMPPEMLVGAPHGLPCDRWALGCLLYSLLVGHSPYAGNHSVVHPTVALRDRILSSHGVAYPRGVGSSAVRDMVNRFMQLNPKARLHTSTAMEHGWIQKYHSTASRDISDVDSEEEFVKCEVWHRPQHASGVIRRVSSPLEQLGFLKTAAVAAAPSRFSPPTRTRPLLPSYNSGAGGGYVLGASPPRMPASRSQVMLATVAALPSQLSPRDVTSKSPQEPTKIDFRVDKAPPLGMSHVQVANTLADLTAFSPPALRVLPHPAASSLFGPVRGRSAVPMMPSVYPPGYFF
ncbi:hypothetical protein FOL47_010125 [Perkinsus chesapeaki]|uniref:Protein kinase domain-containing protein n=1 Tax=Perkinsus chesapeaki TaxID=330153 RepID=A0A7J6MQ84_PERCH|nr:hypothetical protein FOL47_010125 [Perkinsus chesapeaki]